MIRLKQFLFVATAVLGCCLRALAFPSAEQVNSKLRPGLTADEVVAMFGEPGNGRVVPCVDCTLTYIAPIGSLTVEQEGYVGVSIRFAGGGVLDWHVYRGNPSYVVQPVLPRGARWLLWFFGIIFGVGLLSKLFIRFTPRAVFVSDEVARTFEQREIQTNEVPAEFRFITHDTTLEEVFSKLGKPSRVAKIPISAEHGLGYALVSSRTGPPLIVTYEYDLPYHAAVIVMPEFPFEQQSRIRAVLYRPIQQELAEATE